MRSRIINGDCRDVMKTMPDGIFQTCVTSPPYFGHRDYSLDPAMWGDSYCKHLWGDRLSAKKSNQVNQTKWKDNPAIADGNKASSGQFCVKCDAWLGTLGSEPTPEMYVDHIVEIFREVKRVLRSDGTVWLNIGDSYAGTGGRGSAGRKQATNKGSLVARTLVPRGLKAKDLVMIPFRVALALQQDGWWLRSDIIWHKPAPMPESVGDRPTKSHEYIFLLAKSKKYFYDIDAIRVPHSRDWSNGKSGGSLVNAPRYAENSLEKGSAGEHRGDGPPKMNPLGRNKRTVWKISSKPYKGAHFATFPPEIPRLCILAGSSHKACPKCGTAWKRVVEKKSTATRPGRDSKYFDENGLDDIRGDTSECLRHRVINSYSTLGFRPLCNCENNGSGRSVVLDPFAGSGTTCAVALELGRDYIGIEQNPEYCKLAEDRVRQVVDVRTKESVKVIKEGRKKRKE